jgi:hypothetical protein
VRPKALYEVEGGLTINIVTGSGKRAFALHRLSGRNQGLPKHLEGLLG